MERWRMWRNVSVNSPDEDSVVDEDDDSSDIDDEIIDSDDSDGNNDSDDAAPEVDLDTVDSGLSATTSPSFALSMRSISGKATRRPVASMIMPRP